jgi:hypothetical protein
MLTRLKQSNSAELLMDDDDDQNLSSVAGIEIQMVQPVV